MVFDWESKGTFRFDWAPVSVWAGARNKHEIGATKLAPKTELAHDIIISREQLHGAVQWEMW